ncbi:hypothetical protein GCM10018793_70890 [Streptomyces sulfonofaciens]|uniref:Uncharacterized protein n=1 Tax=Streptomyces sulfonofaciens TaxID=68272 RepID=A0A919GRM7_9ACTN|nr:hypothetical protein GCM10018793_70890 [Streptomyces sulfonofaciens]
MGVDRLARDGNAAVLGKFVEPGKNVVRGCLPGGRGREGGIDSASGVSPVRLPAAGRLCHSPGVHVSRASGADPGQDETKNEIRPPLSGGVVARPIPLVEPVMRAVLTVTAFSLTGVAHGAGEANGALHSEVEASLDFPPPL